MITKARYSIALKTLFLCAVLIWIYFLSNTTGNIKNRLINIGIGETNLNIEKHT
jgi:hypothetical protein